MDKRYSYYIDGRWVGDSPFKFNIKIAIWICERFYGLPPNSVQIFDNRPV